MYAYVNKRNRESEVRKCNYGTIIRHLHHRQCGAEKSSVLKPSIYIKSCQRKALSCVAELDWHYIVTKSHSHTCYTTCAIHNSSLYEHN